MTVRTSVKPASQSEAPTRTTSLPHGGSVVHSQACFDGAALAVSLAEGLTLSEAARRASDVAALTVTRIGTQAAVPSLAEVKEWMAQSAAGALASGSLSENRG